MLPMGIVNVHRDNVVGVKCAVIRRQACELCFADRDVVMCLGAVLGGTEDRWLCYASVC